ncbi:MAG TPA: ferritin-like domain-containing protein, partial [Gemmatimonadaceae bacterium]|nr:ferritin-like domain-containing protein [Gemmatimonadaceae bacterium]
MPTFDGDVIDSASAADVVDSLRLALLVTYLQSELYARAVSATGFVAAADSVVFSTIAVHETQHVGLLATLITARGGASLARPAFDFTAKGALPGFAFAAGQYETFRML